MNLFMVRLQGVLNKIISNNSCQLFAIGGLIGSSKVDLAELSP